tara:strand:- start:933 stop:1484 length:552 start_codon:yes stop_codon:yes gene_type:complete
MLPHIHNVVSTVRVGCPIDLKTVALNARNAEYNPRRFRAVIIRIRDPKTTALVFSTGKILLAGAKSAQEAELAGMKYTKILNRLGFPAQFLDFAVHNVVGVSDVRFPIRLEALASEHANFCSYEPELFPGLVYKMLRPKVCLIIFVSGKVVLTGGRTKADLDKAFRSIYPVLREFRKEISRRR